MSQMITKTQIINKAMNIMMDKIYKGNSIMMKRYHTIMIINKDFMKMNRMKINIILNMWVIYPIKRSFMSQSFTIVNQFKHFHLRFHPLLSLIHRSFLVKLHLQTDILLLYHQSLADIAFTQQLSLIFKTHLGINQRLEFNNKSLRRYKKL